MGATNTYSALRRTYDERTRAILEKRKAGVTLQKIADEYGLTRQRIAQILKKDRERQAYVDRFVNAGN